MSFSLSLYFENGTHIPHFLSSPINITLSYPNMEYDDQLYYYDNGWINVIDTCETPFREIDLEKSLLTVQICHLSQFEVLNGYEIQNQGTPELLRVLYILLIF